MKSRIVTILAVLAMISSAARAADYTEEAGFGLLATVANLGYVPAKLGYAVVGATVGGIAYVVTGADLDAATAVWQPALGGTYLLTGAMLRGDEPVHFAATGATTAADDDGLLRPEEPWREEPLP